LAKNDSKRAVFDQKQPIIAAKKARLKAEKSPNFHVAPVNAVSGHAGQRVNSG